MKRKAKDRIEAEVLLRPADPKANLREAARAASVRRLAAAPETVEEVAGRLRDLGFQVTAKSPTSISIAGSTALFERVFKKSPAKDQGQGDELDVPEQISEHVEGVYVQSPPTYFDQ